MILDLGRSSKTAIIYSDHIDNLTSMRSSHESSGLVRSFGRVKILSKILKSSLPRLRHKPFVSTSRHPLMGLMLNDILSRFNLNIREGRESHVISSSVSSSNCSAIYTIDLYFKNHNLGIINIEDWNGLSCESHRKRIYAFCQHIMQGTKLRLLFVKRDFSRQQAYLIDDMFEDAPPILKEIEEVCELFSKGSVARFGQEKSPSVISLTKSGWMTY